MENIILSGMLREFAARFEFSEEPTDKIFERFANYCLLKTDHYDSFEFEKVSTGSAMGVDGVAVVIGGVIVDELDDARDFTKTQFDATFHFIQAKTSARFDLGSFLKFNSTVRAFFQDDPSALPVELHKAFAIKRVVYERSAKLRQLPSVKIQYAYTGEFSIESGPVLSAIDAEATALRAIKYRFGEVTSRICDGHVLAQLYRDTKNDVTKAISFQRHSALPLIKGASAAYIGVVRCSDYVNLLTKEGGDLNKGLFFENVRDFLGEQNPVNSEIAKTINSPEERDRFAILNNGVTIVATRVAPSGDVFQISRFQVVNGCQTSHVLYKNRNKLTDEMYLTVKLVETSDVDLFGRIIATTNSQSQVTKEAFATIKPYHKILEDFFVAMRGSGYNFLYERRPHQFDEQEDISQNWIVSAPTLIKCFISVVMEEPHKVHYYYGRLLQEYNRDNAAEIFAESDYPGLYFASNAIIAKTRAAIGKHSQLNDWLFHLGLLVKKQIAPELVKGAPLRDREFLRLLGRIEDGFAEAFANSARIIERSKLGSEKNRLPEVTKSLIAALGKTRPSSRNALDESVDSSRFRLGDGQYVGTVKDVDRSNNLIAIDYGPFRTSAHFDSSLSGRIQGGARIRFIVRRSVGEVIEVL